MADLEVNSIVFDPNGGDEGNPVFSQGELFFSGNVFHYIDISNVHEPIATHTVVNSSIAQASGDIQNSVLNTVTTITASGTIMPAMAISSLRI